MRVKLVAGALAVLAMALIGSSGANAAPAGAVDPADFSSKITNPLFPLSTLDTKIFEGETQDGSTTIKTRLESRVLAQKKMVDGVEVLVLEEKAYEDDELIEVALDYFAQHRNGDVYYFGENVDNYEDGAIKNHDGQWLAGEDGNEPGVLMAAQPIVGKTYEQELAPGVAEDKATVLSTTESVAVPSGSYTGCLKTRDFSPLDPGIEEFKFYCPGVGLVREEADNEFLDLESVTLAAVQPAPSPTIAAPAPTAQPTTPAGIAAPDTGTGTPSQPEGLPALVTLAGALGLALGLALAALGYVRIARRRA